MQEMAKDTTLSPGMEFGPYLIEGLVAGGGIGQVFAVTHKVYGTKAALKVLNPEFCADPAWRARLAEEGIVGLGLKHPNVLTTREVIEDNERIALVLDLVGDGKTLHRLISREFSTGLPTEQALRLFLGILQGIEYAHEQGVVHGDIKPENVLIQGDVFSVSTWTALVTDFGTVGLKAHPVLLEGVPAVIASPRYASPEHLRGVDALTPSSDIFSCGLLLHYLLSGRHASTARTVDDTVSFLRETTPLVLLIDQPVRVIEVVEQATALEPGDRFLSCREMALELREVLNSLGADFEDDVEADLATEIMTERQELISGHGPAMPTPVQPMPTPDESCAKDLSADEDRRETRSDDKLSVAVIGLVLIAILGWVALAG